MSSFQEGVSITD